MAAGTNVIYISDGENVEAVVLNRPLVKVVENIDAQFALKTGTYAGLRAQATTKADVGLSGIPNVNGSTVNFLRGDGNWITPPNTTYNAGAGITQTGTTFSLTNDSFVSTGTYAGLRAQATTKDDVGLGSVDNFSRASYDLRYLGIGAKAADSELLDGIDSTQFLRSDVSDSMAGNLSVTGTISGNGSGLTNIAGQQPRTVWTGLSTSVSMASLSEGGPGIYIINNAFPIYVYSVDFATYGAAQAISENEIDDIGVVFARFVQGNFEIKIAYLKQSGYSSLAFGNIKKV